MAVYPAFLRGKRKLISVILLLCMFVSFSPATSISFAATNDTIKGNPVSIYDEVTGCTYNYINFNGAELRRTYMGKQSWTMDGKSFLCGVTGSTTAKGTIYLYNTETNEFTEVGTGNVSTSVEAVIGTDNCVYYASGSSIKKYNVDTKETTIVLPASFYYEPSFISVSNDCKYIAFRSTATDYAWCEDGETGIYRYNIAEKKVECYGYKFDASGYSDTITSHILNHHQINPEDPDIVFFAHDTNNDPHYIYDREWTVDFATGEIENIFKQGKQDNDKSVVFTSHESWGASGKYLYMNCYSNSAQSEKTHSIIRSYKDGSHREYMKGTQTGNYGAGHASPSGDDKFTVVDYNQSRHIYVLSNDTYEAFPIYYSEKGCSETDYHPYHAHPNVARNHYRTDWGMVHGEILGVGWYDFTDLTKKVAKGGRYPVNEYIDRVSYEGLDCESENVYYEGREAIYAKAGNYIYLDISDAVVDGTNEKITVTFDYYDNGKYSGWQLWFNENDPLEIIYTDGAVTDEDLAASEDAKVEIERDGSKGWESYTLTIDSGNFENINPYRTDLKIGGGGTDAYIANIQVSNAPAASEIYEGGDGTKENPYQIANVEQLKYFTNSVRTTTDKAEVDSNISYTATKVSDTTVTAEYTPKRYHVFTDKYFELTADIDLSGETWTPVGNLTNVFNGHFNGNGHTISNVYINGTKPVQHERYAFFGATGANAEITNLGIENLTCNFSGSNNKYSVTINNEEYTYNDRLTGAAGFVSTYAGGTFKNCYLKNAEVRDFTEQMSSGGTGAFFGLGYGTVGATESNGYNQMTVKNCYVNGVVLRAHSSSYAFIGPNIKPNSTAELSATDQYRITKTVTNCYTANIRRGYYNDASLGISSKEKNYDGIMYPFASTTRNVTYTNCYTTSVGEKTTASTDGTTWTYDKAEVDDIVLETTDKDTLNSGLVDNSNYYSDVNETNGGYPVLIKPEEPEGWDGVTDKRPEGDGETEETAFLISTKEELLWFKNSVNTVSEDGVSNGYTSYANSYFKLVNDIDFEGYEWEPVGNNKASFNGHFDGNGHVIKNFKISSYYINETYAYANASATSKTAYCTDKLYIYNGFFGRTGGNSVVKNLGIENAKINFWNHDYYYDIVIDESGVLTSSKNYRSNYNGVMVGYTSGKFINCYVKNSEIKNMRRPIGDKNVAGFVGYANASSSFEGCYVKDTDLEASVYSSICGFVGNAIEGSSFTDCYAAGVVENTDLVSNRENETTIYGFGYAENDLNETNCISELADYQAATNTATIYKPATYYSDRSIGDTGATKEEIIDKVTVNGYLISDILNDNINDGYPICEWENAPFKNCIFSTTKDGVTVEGFVADGVIDTISFYKNRTAEDCYMYTVVYDKKDKNRMIGCSIDFIDNSEISAKSTHTIKLTNPITLSGDTSRYKLKLIFVTDNTKFTPLCDEIEF